MIITRTSKLTGVVHTLDLPITQGQLNSWKLGSLIQDVMPNLSPSQREFLITGITEEEWSSLLYDNDEEDEADHYDYKNSSLNSYDDEIDSSEFKHNDTDCLNSYDDSDD